MDPEQLLGEIGALEEGRAFVDGSSMRKVSVKGADAMRWLNDLVTAGVERLEEGGAARSLLLTPTGRVRAYFHVARTSAGYLLIQDPGHAAVDGLLAPYVLSSDVTMDDVTGELAILSLSGSAEPLPGAIPVGPSLLGRGVDLFLPAGGLPAARDALAAAGFVPVGQEAVEVWRIAHGVARFGADFGEGSLPAEAGLEAVIDLAKGCFLGQESVARVRNLGHPPRTLLHVTAPAPVRAGEDVVADGSPVGVVTSVATLGGKTFALVRVGWEAREADLTTASGVALRRP